MNSNSPHRSNVSQKINLNPFTVTSNKALKLLYHGKGRPLQPLRQAKDTLWRKPPELWTAVVMTTLQYVPRDDQSTIPVAMGPNPMSVPFSQLKDDKKI